MSASDIADKIRGKQVSPVEVVKAYLDRIDRVDDKVNAFITVMSDEALDSARQAEADVIAGSIKGPLHGQGGVDINAEGGEVLMSNAAGDMWGRDNLLQMNAEAVTGKKKKKQNPLLNLSKEDYKWLAYAISGEAERDTDDEFGVAASILNRVSSPHFKGSVEDVVNNPG